MNGVIQVQAPIQLQAVCPVCEGHAYVHKAGAHARPEGCSNCKTTGRVNITSGQPR